jgi:hypothetical protein
MVADLAQVVRKHKPTDSKMRSKPAQADIRALVDSFVDELTQHIRTAAVEAVQSALLGGGAPAASSAAPRRGAGKKAKKAGKAKKGGRRVRRSAAEITAAKAEIRRFVQANPGSAMGELSKALGSDPAVIRMQLNELLAEGALRKEGERRGTKYYAGKGRATKAKGAKRAKKATRKKTART